MVFLIILFIVCGFIYGEDYFRLYEPYGTKDTCNFLGVYILSLKWWNVTFNWYTYLDKWQVEFKIKLLVGINPKRYREHYLIFNSTGVKTCTINID